MEWQLWLTSDVKKTFKMSATPISTIVLRPGEDRRPTNSREMRQ